jgi:hypothetical protein
MCHIDPLVNHNMQEPAIHDIFCELHWEFTAPNVQGILDLERRIITMDKTLNKK